MSKLTEMNKKIVAGGFMKAKRPWKECLRRKKPLKPLKRRLRQQKNKKFCAAGNLPAVFCLSIADFIL